MGKLTQNKISFNLCSFYDCSSSNQEHAWYVDSFFILHFPIPLSKRKRREREIERVMLLDSILLSPFYQEKKKKDMVCSLIFPSSVIILSLFVTLFNGSNSIVYVYLQFGNDTIFSSSLWWCVCIWHWIGLDMTIYFLRLALRIGYIKKCSRRIVLWWLISSCLFQIQSTK